MVLPRLVTPHAQGASDRLTFSNIHSRISRQIYRLALPLRALVEYVKDLHI